MTQPKPLTDFNDLHAQRGLEEVRRQLLDAVQGKAATESPASTAVPASDTQEGAGAAGAFEGKNLPAPLQGEGELPEKASETALEDTTFTIEIMLQRFALIMGETKIWDTWTLSVLKKSGFTMMVGKKLAKEWEEHSARKGISMANVRSAQASLPKKGGTGVEAMLGRYILIYGTKDIWDTETRQRIPADSIKLAWAKDWPDWIEHRERRMINQDKLVFDPTMRQEEGAINIFDGLPLSPLTGDQAWAGCWGIQRLLKFLCEGDDDVYQWVLRWLALPLQKPGTKMASALLFHGEVQGAGKSFLFSDIHRRLYGKYSKTLEQLQLEGQYSDWKSQTLYAVFEEIFGGNSKYTHQGTVKHMVTGKTQRIEKKFVSGWEESNHMNVVFLSNEIQPLPIERNDRRLCVCWPNVKVPADIFEPAKVEADRPDDEGLRAWYGFLLSIDMEWTDSKGVTRVFHEHTEPPMNASKQRLIEYGLPAWDVFHAQWKAGFLSIPYTSCQTMDLYAAYKRYCNRSSEKPLTATKFLTNMSIRERKELKRLRSGQSTRQCMVFIVGEQDPDDTRKEIDWLTEECKRFSDSIRNQNPEDDHDC